MSTPKTMLFVLMLVLVIAVFAACAPAATPAPPPVPPTAAPKVLKGELNLLCTPQEEWCAGMKKEFEAKYPGVTVNYIRLSAGEAVTRLRNEKTNPQFDIWWGGPIDSQIAAKKEGLLEPYKTAAQDNLIDPKLMLDSDTPPLLGRHLRRLAWVRDQRKLSESQSEFQSPHVARRFDQARTQGADRHRAPGLIGNGVHLHVHCSPDQG